MCNILFIAHLKRNNCWWFWFLSFHMYIFICVISLNLITCFIKCASITDTLMTEWCTLRSMTNLKHPSTGEYWILEQLGSLERTNLRVRAFFHETVRVCHVYCNFKIGFTCRITVSFGTLNGGSLLINTLASNICFSYRNMFQNVVDALSKIVDAFLSKSSKFHLHM